MATTTIARECLRKGTRNSCHPTDATCERIGDRDVWLYRRVFCGPCMRRAGHDGEHAGRPRKLTGPDRGTP